ncbi:hypothetical protein LTR37_010946 [Vermiconidia calcicola]|uniref:Uncharacterized protein n=1 Tax=Vermiconidia calcicola TaxID=1690605 RepID=A0ACC3N3S0_9PEZI|nr:hypothetical protein LTR37_010946 [Vermiconidia calcicola]
MAFPQSGFRVNSSECLAWQREREPLFIHRRPSESPNGGAPITGIANRSRKHSCWTGGAKVTIGDMEFETIAEYELASRRDIRHVFKGHRFAEQAYRRDRTRWMRNSKSSETSHSRHQKWRGGKRARRRLDENVAEAMDPYFVALVTGLSPYLDDHIVDCDICRPELSEWCQLGEMRDINGDQVGVLGRRWQCALDIGFVSRAEAGDDSEIDHEYIASSLYETGSIFEDEDDVALSGCASEMEWIILQPAAFLGDSAADLELSSWETLSIPGEE